MYNRNSDNKCCFGVESVPDVAKVADMLQARDRDEICLEKVRLESKMKPRLRAVCRCYRVISRKGERLVGYFR